MPDFDSEETGGWDWMDVLAIIKRTLEFPDTEVMSCPNGPDEVHDWKPSNFASRGVDVECYLSSGRPERRTFCSR